jgi:hypothetical protein
MSMIFLVLQSVADLAVVRKFYRRFWGIDNVYSHPMKTMACESCKSRGTRTHGNSEHE